MYSLDVFNQGSWHQVSTSNAPSRRKAVAEFKATNVFKDIFFPELFDTPEHKARRVSWRVRLFA